jgi:nucleoside 2-deoxyribosyltransferase
MDGADPDSGTAWEVGYAYGKGKPTILIRTDLRKTGSDGSGYNAMLSQSATLKVDLVAASQAEVADAVLKALQQLEGRG